MWKDLLSDMSEELLITIVDTATSIMNILQFVFSLLLVVVVAGCFLGRSVIFTRKQVILAFGIMGLHIIESILFNVFFTVLGLCCCTWATL